MSDGTHRLNIYGGGVWVAIALLLIAFYGEPDLVDSIIHYLNNATCR